MSPITDVDLGFRQIQSRIEKSGNLSVVVGVLGNESVDGSSFGMVDLANLHEFGGTIKHPGGTDFGFKKEGDIIKGKVRFLKKGEGFASIGKTKAHDIVIPERPAFRLTFDESKDKLNASRLLRFDQYVMGQITLRKALFFLGDEYKSMVRATIQDGSKLEANATSTVKKKGSDIPLVDSGGLLKSITSEIRKG